MKNSGKNGIADINRSDRGNKDSSSLTFKQRLFVSKYILSNGNATQSALIVYNCKSKNVAGVIGNQNLRKLKIREEINRILATMGIDDEAVAYKLKDNLLSYRSLNSIKTILRLKGLI